MTIMFYDTETHRDELLNSVDQLKKTLGDDLIVLPKNYDLMLDCSIDQLYTVKSIIDTAIALKIEKEGDVAQFTPSTPNSGIPS